MLDLIYHSAICNQVGIIFTNRIKVVCNGLVSHSSLNHTHRLVTVILTVP
jgi:hypothetical protein